MSGLTVEQVLELHEDLINEHGGAHGVLDLGKLESALEQPTGMYFGHMQYPALVQQAAAYLYYVAEAHAFVDGNKRTVVACCLIWLELNGKRHDMSEDSLFELTLMVADDGLEAEALAGLISLSLF